MAAAEAEGDVLERVCGVRREYKFGRKKASEAVQLEEDCPRSGAFMYLGVRVGEHQLLPGTLRRYTCTPTTGKLRTSGNTCVTAYLMRVHMFPCVTGCICWGKSQWYRVHYAGTHVRGAQNVGTITLAGTISRHTCTRRSKRSATILLDKFTFPPVFVHTACVFVRSGVTEASGGVPRVHGDRGLE